MYWSSPVLSPLRGNVITPFKQIYLSKKHSSNLHLLTPLSRNMLENHVDLTLLSSEFPSNPENC